MKHTKQGISPFWALLGVLGVEEVVQCMVALWDIHPRHDEDLREPLVRRQGSQVSMRVARGCTDFPRTCASPGHHLRGRQEEGWGTASSTSFTQLFRLSRDRRLEA